MNLFDLTPSSSLQLAGAGVLFVLLALLLASFVSRARVFCQYLHHMTGIELKPKRVRTRFQRGGRAAVRDMLIELLIREDLADTSRVVTPDSKPDTSVFEFDS